MGILLCIDVCCSMFAVNAAGRTLCPACPGRLRHKQAQPQQQVLSNVQVPMGICRMSEA
jgi:hypothetical protein